MKDEPLRTVQPVVVPAQLYTFGTFVSGFLALVPAFFASAITMAITKMSGPSTALGILTYLGSFALLMALIGWRAFSGPGVTTYRIYRDRIESEEGLVNRRRRTVLIGRIIDVHLTEGVLQQTRGAGTVTLVIQPIVSPGQGHLAHQVILLCNIPQPREVYDLIRSLALDRKIVEEGDLD